MWAQMDQFKRSCAVTTASAQDLAACTKAGMAKSPRTSSRWCPPHPLPGFMPMIYWGALRSKVFSWQLVLQHNNRIFTAQGADNFRKEFKQLRRSFRFNEYKEIREQNPPTNPISRVSTSSTCHTISLVFPGSSLTSSHGKCTFCLALDVQQFCAGGIIGEQAGCPWPCQPGPQA